MIGDGVLVWAILAAAAVLIFAAAVLLAFLVRAALQAGRRRRARRRDVGEAHRLAEIQGVDVDDDEFESRSAAEIEEARRRFTDEAIEMALTDLGRRARADLGITPDNATPQNARRLGLELDRYLADVARGQRARGGPARGGYIAGSDRKAGS